MDKKQGQTRDDREALCRRCGKCCREKYDVDGFIFYGRGYCEHFDPETKLCRVYDRRGEISPTCLSVEEGIRRGVLPGDCPYVVNRPDYIAPVEEWEDEELERLIREGTDDGIV